MPKDAIALLKEDHREVQAKLTELTASTPRAPKKRERLCAEIAQMLEAHMAIEEELFYPAIARAAEKADDRKMVAEAREEHHAAKVVLQDLRRASAGTLEFGGKAKVLCELIDHHVEEEEGTMFPRVRKLCDRAMLRELGAAMEARKEEILGAVS